MNPGPNVLSPQKILLIGSHWPFLGTLGRRFLSISFEKESFYSMYLERIKCSKKITIGREYPFSVFSRGKMIKLFFYTIWFEE
jgi:hypothetical protein